MIPKQHYNYQYLYRERLYSYIYQVECIRDINPKNILEIGVGTGLQKNILNYCFPESKVFTLDIEPSLAPDFCGDVLNIPVKNKSIDTVFCCQVLEHIPYDDFKLALKELKRICMKRIVISLPDVTPFFFIRIYKLRRLFPSLWKGFSLPSIFPEKHSYEKHGQHYWEIGKKSFSSNRIKKELQACNMKLIDDFRMVERPYWHFFIIEV